MIKFFRRFRQGLLSENKFSKYLIYGLGEISETFSLYPNNNNEFVLLDRFCLLKKNGNNEIISYVATSGSREPKYYKKIK